jgi:hypothetical protein
MINDHQSSAQAKLPMGYTGHFPLSATDEKKIRNRGSLAVCDSTPPRQWMWNAPPGGEAVVVDPPSPPPLSPGK